MNPEPVFQLDQRQRETFACVDEYERCVEQGGLPDLRVVLNRVRPQDTQAALLELVKTDLEYRWKLNEPKSVEEYLGEFPELSESEASGPELQEADAQARRSASEVTISSSAMLARKVAARDTDGPGRDESTMRGTQSNVETWSDDLLPSEVDGYRYIRQIGEGGFGAVMLCVDLASGREVAVKVAKHEWGAGVADLAQHEASSVARLVHPNIVQLIDCGKLSDGRPFLVYEYVSGKTLSARFKARDFTLEQAVEWIAQIAGALHHAHLAGLIHRDIKPANILIDQDGKPWLTDFGLAKIDDRFVTDDSGVVLGTLSYMSPEQAGGRSHWATPQSDVYSLGVMLYEALCGQPPFVAADRDELLDQVRERPPRPPRSVRQDVPRELATLAMASLAKQPSDRVQTAEDFEQALRQYQNPQRAEVAPPIPATKTNRWMGPAAAVMVGLAGAVAVLMNPTLRPAANPTAAAATPTDTALPASMYLQVLPADQADGVPHLVTGADLPLATGDGVQVRAEVTDAGYLYLFGATQGGSVRLLSAPQVADGQPARQLKLHYPPRADQWQTLKSREGIVLFAVGASRSPLTDEQLATMTQLRLKMPPPVNAATLLRIAEPWPEHQQDKPHTTRGAGGGADAAEFEVAERSTYAIPDQLSDAMQTMFDGYHALLFSYTDSANRGAAKP